MVVGGAQLAAVLMELVWGIKARGCPLESIASGK